MREWPLPGVGIMTVTLNIQGHDYNNERTEGGLLELLVWGG